MLRAWVPELLTNNKVVITGHDDKHQVLCGACGMSQMYLDVTALREDGLLGLEVEQRQRHKADVQQIL